jgi:predicted NBD/HSP70 family sugar kinase
MQSYLPAYIRNKNRALVLKLFLESENLTRADITKLTNVSFPTVIKIVDYLLSKRILAETSGGSSVSESKLGRKGQPLRLNASAYSAVGIHFEGNYLHVGLVDLSYTLLDLKAFHYSELGSERAENRDYARISAHMTDTIRHFQKGHPETKILGVGVGLPGIIDNAAKTVIVRTFDAPQQFLDLFVTFKNLKEIPFFIENDMNAASLGEWLLRKESNLIYLALGTGFGGGVIMNGQVWQGASNYAGNMGNLLSSYEYGIRATEVESRRTEGQINISAIKERFGVDIRKNEDVPDEAKKEISAYLAEYMIPLIYNLSQLLDTSNYVIAGVTAEFLGETLFDRINSGLKLLLPDTDMFPIARITPTIHKQAGVIGAAAIALRSCIPALLNDDA